MSHRRPLVCYMTQGYRVRGGHEAHLLHYATELRQHGFDTRILVLDALPREEHLFMRLLRERGIPLESVRRMNDRLLRLELAMIAPWWTLIMRARGRLVDRNALSHWLADRRAARALRQRLAAMRPDVVHVLGRLADFAWPAIPAHCAIMHHGTEGRLDDTWDAAELNAFRRFAQSAALNLAPGDGVVANLQREFGLSRPIVSLFTICPDQSGLIPPNAAARPSAPSAPLRFGILCRMTPEKGIDVLLEALRLYGARHGHLDFVFAGSGVLEDKIRAALAEKALQGVRLQTTFDSPVDILSQLDVFVHPSLSDAMPMAVAEALMCGVPCIVTRVGGLPDLVRDGREGLVIAPGCAEDIVSAMERFAALTPTERDAFRARARARYDDVCRPERIGLLLAAHYRAIMGDPRRERTWR